MMFSRLLRYDLRAGSRHTRNGWLIVLLMFVVFSLYFVTYLHRLSDYVGTLPSPSVGDFYVYLFRGDIAPSPDDRLGFHLPSTWLLIQVFVHYLTGFYVCKDLKEQGHQVLLRAGSTGCWWLSKCIWCVFQCILYYGVLLLICVLFCFMTGGTLQIAPNQAIVARMIRQEFTLSKVSFQIHVLWMPVLISAALSLAQQAIGLFLGEGFSFIIICSWLFLSVYTPHPLMIGNYTMLLRSVELYPPAGVDYHVGIGLALLISFISLLGGYYKLKATDIGLQR